MVAFQLLDISCHDLDGDLTGANQMDTCDNKAADADRSDQQSDATDPFRHFSSDHSRCESTNQGAEARGREAGERHVRGAHGS